MAVGETAWHLPAVVAGVDDDGVVESAAFFELSDGFAKGGVHLLRGGEVARDLLPHLGRVWQIGGHADFGEVDACGDAIDEFKPMQRSMNGAQPKEKGMSSFRSARKVAKSLNSLPAGFCSRPNSLNLPGDQPLPVKPVR